jgi:hypothetical protein
MPTIAQLVQQIGVPQVTCEAEIMEKAAAGILQDEETTDNGSILSDNDVSISSGSQSARQEAPAAAHLLTSNAVASRRDALRQAGQEVLVKISPSGVVPGSRKKAQNATAAQQPRRRQQKQKADVVPVERHQQPTVKAPVVPAVAVNSAPTVPDALEPLSKETPMKVHGMVSTSRKAAVLSNNSKLDLTMPVKKHPILAETQKGSYDPNCPLKKRVPQFLLEEAPWGIRA